MTSVSYWLYIATVAGISAFLVWLWGRASGGTIPAAALTATSVAVWLTVTGVLSLSGSSPPGAAAVLGPALLRVAIVRFILSQAGPRNLKRGMPLAVLNLAQVFRVRVEGVLAMLVVAGRLPTLLSWHATKFDILTGLTAPLVAWAAARGMRRSLIV